MHWKLKKVKPSIHGDFEWHFRTRKGFKLLKVRVYPETLYKEHFFTIRTDRQDFGLDLDGSFNTLQECKAYVDEVAEAWRADRPVNWPGPVTAIGEAHRRKLTKPSLFKK